MLSQWPTFSAGTSASSGTPSGSAGGRTGTVTVCGAASVSLIVVSRLAAVLFVEARIERHTIELDLGALRVVLVGEL